MSKFTLITKTADGIGIAFQLQRDGHDVKVHLLDNYYESIMEGLLNKEKSLDKAIAGDTTIIFDQTGSKGLSERLFDAGKYVVGAGMGKRNGEPINDLIEDDRNTAFNLVTNLGITTSEWHNFKTGKEAVVFLKGKGKDKRWVAKPNGKLSTAMTFPSKDNEELIPFIEKIDKLLKEGLILQEFVEGTEISTEVWCSGGKYVMDSINHTLETKKFLDDNLGPNTGCSSSLVWFCGESKVYKQGLAKMIPFISNTDYTGFLDVNGIVDKKGKYHWLEFTPRFGYSAWYAESILLPDIGKAFDDLASRKMKSLKPKKGFGTAIRITTSPYPFEAPKEPPDDMKGKIVGKFEDTLNALVYSAAKDHDVKIDIFDDKVIPLDIYADKDRILTGGHDGVIAEALGYGTTIEESFNDAYKTVKSIEVPNMQYRTDAIKDARKRYNEIQKWL